MATTGTQTIRDIVTDALRKSGALGFGEAAAAEDADAAMRELNYMLKSWQNNGYNLWSQTAGSLTLTTAAGYTLDPVRPLNILSARLRRGGTDVPMIELTRDEYDRLPRKGTTGTPTQFYYDRQRETAVFYVWPVLRAANGETVEFTYERELDDITNMNADIDVPGEWWEAVVYNLATRIIDTLPSVNPNPAIYTRAEVSLRDALAADREGSVYFCGEDYRC